MEEANGFKAEVFGKRHKNVLQSVDLLECSEQFKRLNFQPVEIIEKNAIGGQFVRKHYEMTKDGFVFLCMGFTGKKARKPEASKAQFKLLNFEGVEIIEKNAIGGHFVRKHYEMTKNRNQRFSATMIEAVM